ncbi:MAG: hypothetical protein ACRDQA_21005 [Nocardioidaceae bacterium]
MTLTEARVLIGHDVVYHPISGGGDRRGVITSIDDVFVYVRYRDEDRAKGTDPALLSR